LKWPFQFNVPFSVIIFSDDFVEKYTKYLDDGNSPNKAQLTPFVEDYINFWMKKRGEGHYNYINKMMFILFNHSLTNVPESSKAQYIEKQITMPYIVNYIVDVLVHFTKFKQDGSLNLREYLDNVFIKIVDVWGFITIYYQITEFLSSGYEYLNKEEIKIFNQLRFILIEYLYTPRHEPINMNKLYSDLKIITDLSKNILTRKNKTTSIKNKKYSFKTISNTFKKTRKNKKTQ